MASEISDWIAIVTYPHEAKGIKLLLQVSSCRDDETRLRCIDTHPGRAQRRGDDAVTKSQDRLDGWSFV
jgi:hypothetical protein